MTTYESEQQNSYHSQKLYFSTWQSRRDVLDKSDIVSIIYQEHKCILSQSTNQFNSLINNIFV